MAVSWTLRAFDLLKSQKSSIEQLYMIKRYKYDFILRYENRYNS